MPGWRPPANPDDEATAVGEGPSEGACRPAAPPDGTLVQGLSADGGTLVQAAPSAAALAAMAAAPPPIRVQGYEIIAELGRGGMGVVYLARQAGLNRLVALKMILSGDYADHTDLMRFRLEAEAAAKLQHPNIVQVYEISEADGRPYFCLEFVDGGSLVRKHAGNPQPVRQAADLLMQLARAMEYAHARNIVHRDLKPANILLTTEGAPKITDFGLAKRLDDRDSRTQSGSVLGTPSYMAPEQAHGRTRDVGPAADIYSLGAIFYEALVGRPPFKGETILDTLEQVRSQEPVPPSRLRPKTPRDLETICLKCLEKEPAKRYARAADLAEDLRRYMAGEPILARPTPAWERAWKWARRRPMAAALITVSALFGLSLVVSGLAFGEYQRRQAAEQTRLRHVAEAEHDRAKQNYERARAAVDQMLTQVGQQRLAHEPRMEKLRRDLLTRALRFYERFLEENGADPEVRWETARSRLRVGDIQEMLGEHDAAEASYNGARAAFAELAAAFPADARYRQDLATCLNNRGQLLKDAGRTPEAEASFREALGLRQRLVEEVGGEDDRREMANVGNNLGILLLAEDRCAEAETVLRDALRLRKPLADASADPRRRLDLAKSLDNLGALLAAVGRQKEAEESVGQALDLLSRLRDGHPDAPEYRQELAVGYNHLGNLWRDVDPKKAEKAYRDSLQLREGLVQDFPTVPVYRQEKADALHDLAITLQAAGRRDEAETAYDQALAIEKKLADGYPSVPDYAYALARSYNLRGVDLHNANRLSDAEDFYNKALKLLEPLAAGHPDVPSFRQELANVLQNLAVLYETTNRADKGTAYLHRSRDLRRRLADAHPNVPGYRQDLAAAQLNLGVLWQKTNQAADAEACYRDAVERFAALAEDYPAVPDYRHLLAIASKNLGVLLGATPRPKDAEEALGRAVGLLRALKDEQPGVPIYRQELAQSLNELGILLARVGRDPEAEKVWGEVLPLQEVLTADFPKNAVYREELATYHRNLGSLHVQDVRLNQAEKEYLRAVDLLEDLAKADPDNAVYLQDLIVPYANLAALLSADVHTRDEAERCWKRLAELQGRLAAAERAALDSDPANADCRRGLCDSLLGLAQALVELDDHAGAAAAVADLVKAAPPGWSEQTAAAACLARCAGLAAKDEKLAASKREELARAYGDRAVELLRQAFAAGHKDVDALKNSKDFDPLRSRDDFKRLVNEAEKP
jgi:tetratricopeptide (TPR) repeat protein